MKFDENFTLNYFLPNCKILYELKITIYNIILISIENYETGEEFF